jgi:hypothetical protein
MEKGILVGVAYGHMIPPLKEKLGSLDTYDIKKATDSQIKFTEGNIVDIKAGRGVLVIDDSYTSKITLKAKEPFAMTHLVAIDTPLDVYKVQCFTRNCNEANIFSKIDIKHACSEVMKNILFPSDGKQPFKYVRLLKFGKLHNGEVFLFLSNNYDYKNAKGESSIVTDKIFQWDVATIGDVMTMANMMVQLVHDNWALGASINVELKRLCMKLMVSSMPMTHNWYVDYTKRTYTLFGSNIMDDLGDGDVGDPGAGIDKNALDAFQASMSKMAMLYK